MQIDDEKIKKLQELEVKKFIEFLKTVNVADTESKRNEAWYTIGYYEALNDVMCMLEIPFDFILLEKEKKEAGLL